MSSILCHTEWVFYYWHIVWKVMKISYRSTSSQIHIKYWTNVILKLTCMKFGNGLLILHGVTILLIRIKYWTSIYYWHIVWKVNINIIIKESLLVQACIMIKYVGQNSRRLKILNRIWWVYWNNIVLKRLKVDIWAR